MAQQTCVGDREDQTTSDLLIILSWVCSKEECLMWGGPRIRYPATPETAWADMEASAENAFVLVDAAFSVVGFGQVLPRGGKSVHPARLIVAPGARGQGVGRELCIALMNIGAVKHRREWFTLNVYEFNKSALKLYGLLGFEAKDMDDSGAVAMIRPRTNVSARVEFSRTVQCQSVEPAVGRKQEKI